MASILFLLGRAKVISSKRGNPATSSAITLLRLEFGVFAADWFCCDTSTGAIFLPVQLEVCGVVDWDDEPELEQLSGVEQDTFKFDVVIICYYLFKIMIK